MSQIYLSPSYRSKTADKLAELERRMQAAAYDLEEARRDNDKYAKSIIYVPWLHCIEKGNASSGIF